MEAAVFPQVFDRFCARKPFLPFALELVSGTRLEVSHPETLSVHDRHLVFASTRGVRSIFTFDAVVRFVDTTGG